MSVFYTAVESPYSSCFCGSLIFYELLASDSLFRLCFAPLLFLLLFALHTVLLSFSSERLGSLSCRGWLGPVHWLKKHIHKYIVLYVCMEDSMKLRGDCALAVRQQQYLSCVPYLSQMFDKYFVFKRSSINVIHSFKKNSNSCVTQSFSVPY